jgi:hypothetical protein
MLPNYFSRLHKWAFRQDENFLTESLALVLETLLEQTPEVGVALVAELTNAFIYISADDVSKLEIQTQVSTSEGRPDLEIRIPDRLAVFEVKCEAEVRRGQLEGYREYLRHSEFPHTMLGLITKYAPDLPGDAEQPDRVVRWYEVADALERVLCGQGIADSVSQFVCQQFHDFLKERNMTITQVGWQLTEGAKALRSFLVMLLEAANGCQVTAKRYMDLDENGFILADGKYWIGLQLQEPQKLWFATRCRIDPVAAGHLEGTVEKGRWSWVDGEYSWWRGADLESEDVHFYHRSKVGQIQWLEKFLRECLDMARRIESPCQLPPPPSDSEV